MTLVIQVVDPEGAIKNFTDAPDGTKKKVFANEN